MEREERQTSGLSFPGETACRRVRGTIAGTLFPVPHLPVHTSTVERVCVLRGLFGKTRAAWICLAGLKPWGWPAGQQGEGVIQQGLLPPSLELLCLFSGFGMFSRKQSPTNPPTSGKQVRGVGVWAASVVRAEVKAERCGVPTLKAGRHYTPTAYSRNGPATNRAASACAIGTRSCTTGS